MSWTFTTSGAAIAKAGLTESTFNDDSGDPRISGSVLLQWSDEAESLLCDTSRVDLVTNFASLTANGKQVLGNLASNLVGQKIAFFLRDEYASNREFETLLDIIENDVRRGLALISEDRVKTYLGAT